MCAMAIPFAALETPALDCQIGGWVYNITPTHAPHVHRVGTAHSTPSIAGKGTGMRRGEVGGGGHVQDQDQAVDYRPPTGGKRMCS